MQMAKTPYWILERDPGASYFRMRRTSKPLEASDDYSRDLEKVKPIFRAVNTSYLGLLVDVRDGPIRNDPDFENAARPYQELMLNAFGRVAILVKTPVGKMQMQRIVAVVAPKVPVFDDEQAALAFMSTKP
jgi:hypothetical protein